MDLQRFLGLNLELGPTRLPKENSRLASMQMLAQRAHHDICICILGLLLLATKFDERVVCSRADGIASKYRDGP